MENGRCRMHGGNNKGADPEKLLGNKNALKTGEHEAIFLDTLEADEQELFDKVSDSKAKLLDEEIRLITIRERRMLKRIASLSGQDLTVVEEVDGTNDKGGMFQVKRQGTLGQIQSIEDALTRVQAHKSRLIELKHRFEADIPIDEDDPLYGLTQALERSRKQREED